jgi:poly(3-hydroxybutyrate) depolymerase
VRWTRRRAVTAALLALVLGVGSAAPPAGALDPVTTGTDTRVVLDSGRSYLLHTPPQLRLQPRLAEGRQALLVLHGLRSNPRDVADEYGFSELADRDGVLVAYPAGVRRSFNAGLCCGEAAALRVDDVGFLSAVVADLRDRGVGRVSVVGFSNGGMMAYRLACERPDLVDTVGVFAGTLQVPRCDGPITALHLHGAEDGLVPYDGASSSPVLKTFLRAVDTIPEAAPGSSITVRRLAGFGHRWTQPGDEVDATAEFWRFAGMHLAGAPTG